MRYSKSLAGLVLCEAALASPWGLPFHWKDPFHHDSPSDLPVSSEQTCGGIHYVNRGLVAYGTVAADARDKKGDTLGGFGSAIAADVKSFRYNSHENTISGTLYAVPDRGWNTEGTIDYQSRIQKFHMSFTPTYDRLSEGKQNLRLELTETILLYKDRTPTTGLEAASIIPASGFFPDLPAARRADGSLAPALDLEGLVRLRDGSFWLSDEYGPYLYHFTRDGHMDAAVAPPVAFLPFVDGQKSFASGNPPVGSSEKAQDDPDTGRANNHGFEGLAISPDERYLTVQLQEALVEDGGTHSTRQNKTRQLTYDVSNRHHPRLISENVVDQPARDDPDEDKNPRSTSASDLHWLSRDQFLILTRDSGHGRGSGNDSPSNYRHLDIVSTRGASNLAGQEEAGNGAVTVAPNGYLLPDIATEQYCEFIDFNNNTDLARFNLHNGPPFQGDLNEKWESIAVLPVLQGMEGYGRDEYFIISVSDNDFITQNGYYNFGQTKYADASGQDVSTQVLVWQAKLPEYKSNGIF